MTERRPRETQAAARVALPRQFLEFANALDRSSNERNGSVPCCADLATDTKTDALLQSGVQITGFRAGLSLH